MLSPKTLPRDLMAGVVVAFVGLPLSLASAEAAGVQPQVGLAAGIVGGLVAALFGGSELTVCGPATVLGVLLLSITSRCGSQGLLIACLACGLLQIGAGWLRLGRAARYVPLPVISGFTCGLAILIVLGQLPTLLGIKRLLDVYEVPVIYLWEHRDWIDWSDSIVGAVTVLVMILAPKNARVPPPLVALLAGCLTAALLPLAWSGADVDHLEPLALRLAMPSFHGVGLNEVGELALESLGLFFLTTMQTLLCALSCDSQAGTQHHSDQELIGTGLANLAVLFVGALPVTGVFTRSAAAIRSGAATRMTAVTQSVVLLLLALGLAVSGLGELVPLAALAGILTVTGARMFQWGQLKRTLRASPAEGAVLLATLAVTAGTTNMLAGVLAGMSVALAVVAWKAAQQLARLSSLDLHTHAGGRVAVHSVRGPFFFGAAPEFSESLGRLREHGALVLDLTQAWNLDTTACEAIGQLARSQGRKGTRLLLCGLGGNRAILERYGTLAAFEEENVLPDLDAALARARQLVGNG
jgi:SulP family sulfate permease